MDALYTAIAHASGGGRDGHVRSEDDRLDFDTRPPAELGGSGEGTNPEQLFAAGYSACFLGAIHAVGREQGLDTSDAAVSASVSLGKSADTGFEIAVELDVYIPKLSVDEATKVAATADSDICPYSKAISGNVPVKINIVE